MKSNSRLSTPPPSPSASGHSSAGPDSATEPSAASSPKSPAWGNPFLPAPESIDEARLAALDAQSAAESTLKCNRNPSHVPASPPKRSHHSRTERTRTRSAGWRSASFALRAFLEVLHDGSALVTSLCAPRTTLARVQDDCEALFDLIVDGRLAEARAMAGLIPLSPPDAPLTQSERDHLLRLWLPSQIPLAAQAKALGLSPVSMRDIQVRICRQAGADFLAAGRTGPLAVAVERFQRRIAKLESLAQMAQTPLEAAALLDVAGREEERMLRALAASGWLTAQGLAAEALQTAQEAPDGQRPVIHVTPDQIARAREIQAEQERPEPA